MERQLVYSAIRTPDGTLLESRHVHDFVTHKDKNGETYMLDGGYDYIRTSVNIQKPEELFLYSDSPHEELREVISRGSRGEDGKQPLKYIKLKDIDDEHLEALIKYEQELRPKNRFLPIYIKEQEFRNL